MDIFNCCYCAGVGFEDYPICHIPCRIEEHKERHEKNILHMDRWFRMHPLPEPLIGKPKGNWQWAGRAWKNLDYT